MHPQIQKDEPGNCPICGMELVATRVDATPVGESQASAKGHEGHIGKPHGYACAMNCLPPQPEQGPCPVCGMEMQPVHVEADAKSDGAPRQLIMSAEAVALANIETDIVRRGEATREIRLVGELVEDPRRRIHISANIGGRVDVLLAEFEGDVIEAGEPLAEIYSPELLAVQEELFQAAESVRRSEAGGASTSIAQSARDSLAAVRRRLVLAGLLPEQVEELLVGGAAREHLTLKATSGGTVTSRYVERGDYVEREQRLLTLMDYGVLWAELEAFQSDLEWLALDQRVAFALPAFPGRTFEGTVSWIAPAAAPETRTIRVRLDVDNGEGILKPGMYLTAQAVLPLDSAIAPLLIPHSAPLITGKRAVVYVMNESTDRPVFEGREIELGPRVREGYVVLTGLKEGERVVTRGAFQIDSSLQILARPSMMSPNGGQEVQDHSAHGGPPAPEEAKQEAADIPREVLAEMLPVYLRLQSALAEDQLEPALEAGSVLEAIAAKEGLHPLHDSLRRASSAGTLGKLREVFDQLSKSVVVAVKTHGSTTGEALYIAHCPMTFGWRGSDWVQGGRDIRNPYFGAEMYTCGMIDAEVPAHE